MKKFKIAALCGALLAFCLPLAVWGGDELTKGEILDILLSSAPDYTSYISAEDIVSGYNEGDFREDKLAEDIEMLVMISRAFPFMEEPKGVNLAELPQKAEERELPYWAQKHYDYLNKRGIITSNTVLDDSVTREELDMYLKRVWHYCAQSPKDDFYAYANRDALIDNNNGEVNVSSFSDVNLKTAERVRNILKNLKENGAKTTQEEKILAVYESSLAMLKSEGSLSPLKTYISSIESSKNKKELAKALLFTDREIQDAALFGFDLTVDIKDSSKCLPCFQVYSPTFNYADFSTDEYKELFIGYVTKLLTMYGQASESAEFEAERLYNFEKGLSYHCLTESDAKDPAKTFNKMKVSELQEMFDDIDLIELAKTEGLTLAPTDDVIVFDRGLLYNFALAYNEDLSLMKTIAKVSILDMYGPVLSKDCIEIQNDFQEKILGSPLIKYTDEEYAAEITKNLLSGYVGRLYCDRYFSEEDEKNVMEITKLVVSAYKQRIKNADWMSETTRQKAIKKLDELDIKIGGDRLTTDVYATADLKASRSFYKNYIALVKASRAENSRQQNAEVDRGLWMLPAYMTNASYVPAQNSMTLPAGILEAPFYSADASFEENMGGIGMIIAHELCHALDDTGALYDEKGNYNDWWTPEDYILFSEKCSKIADFYDGEEAAADITTNGMRTLGENIADLGAAVCAVDAVKQNGGDLDKFYISYAKTWSSIYSRSVMEYQSKYDTHTDPRLRVNLSLKNVKDFADVYGKDENRGMYVPDDEKVGLW